MRILMTLGVGVLLSSSAWAQVHVEVVAPPPPRVTVSAPPPRAVVVSAPAVRYTAPPQLIEVQPGVQVVEDSDDEVFFTDGYYWHASPEGVWYRTRSWRGGWVAAPVRVVPVALARMPRGEYRHYRRDERHEERRAEREDRQDERRVERQDRKEERRMEKDERRFEKDQRKEERREEKRGRKW